MPKSKSKQYYDPHGGVTMLRNWIDTLKEKTGRDLDEWTTLIKAKGRNVRIVRSNGFGKPALHA